MTQPETSRPRRAIEELLPEPAPTTTSATTTASTSTPTARAPKARAPRKPLSVPVKVALVLLAVALVVGGIVVWRMRSAPATPKVGDCVTLSGTADLTKVKVVGCASGGSDVVHHVVRSVKDTAECGDDELYYTRTKASTQELIEVLCLVPELKKDACYSTADAVTKQIECSKADASDPTAYKVVDRHDDAKGACGNDPKVGAVVFEQPSPGITYCTSALHD